MFSSTARTRSVEGTAESSGVVGADGGERVLQDLGGIDIIHLAVGEIAFFSSGINEFRNFAKSQAESFSALSCMGKERFC